MMKMTYRRCSALLPLSFFLATSWATEEEVVVYGVRLEQPLTEVGSSVTVITGAEIEEAIVSARYLASARDAAISQQDIKAALDRTYPISVLRAERSCSRGPMSRRRPEVTMATRSQTISTSERMWEEKSTVLPCS